MSSPSRYGEGGLTGPGPAQETTGVTPGPPAASFPTVVGNGSEGHRVDLDPRSRVGRRWIAGAFGRRNGAPARALAEKLAWIAEHETNPWVLIKLAEVLRDSLDGKLPTAPPEAKVPRRLARIILTNRHAPAPPAEAPAAEPDSPGEHFEGDERFVAMPPPE